MVCRTLPVCAICSTYVWHWHDAAGWAPLAPQDRLRAALADVGELFRGPANEATALVSTCAAIATGWQATYLAMRERIEASGHHARWEFSRGLLFEATNYAGEVCTGGKAAGFRLKNTNQEVEPVFFLPPCE